VDYSVSPFYEFMNSQRAVPETCVTGLLDVQHQDLWRNRLTLIESDLFVTLKFQMWSMCLIEMDLCLSSSGWVEWGKCMCTGEKKLWLRKWKL